MKFNRKLKSVTMGLIVTLAVGGMVGCSSKPEDNSNIYKDIDGAKTVKLIEDTKDILILDVRTAEEYETGHILNAINMPLEEVEDRMNEIDTYKDKTVVAYCKTGNRSGKAGKILGENGFKDVYNAADGVEEFDYELVK
ncbi:MAG: rhodanese-like domain-containing protein [Romboutsia sp.]